MASRLTSISVYPLKSGAGRSVATATVEPLGVADDRRWMVADADGECVTARRDRALLRVTASPTAQGIRLAHPGHRDLEVSTPSAAAVEVTVHGRPVHGIPAGAQASRWLGEVLGRDDVRLVHLGRPRPLNPARSQPGDATAFADAYPVTLASAVSLSRLQDWVTESALERGEEPVELTMERFRPNLVIEEGLEAFAEDGWRSVCVGEVRFDVATCIDRCSMTTIDPTTLESGHEPIRSLARHHAWDGTTWFGIQLIPRGAGTIRVGDAVRPTSGVDAAGARQPRTSTTAS
jgi:uncharacterized protein